MSKANELMARVIDRMTARGLNPCFVNYMRKKDRPFTEINGKRVNIAETRRRNGTEEDVTVTLEVDIQLESEFGTRKRIFKIKVPKDASERVIDKRLDKVEEILNA